MGTITRTIGNNLTTGLGANTKILQVVHAVIGQTDMSNTNGYIGAGCSITPSSTSSKIQIFVDVYLEKHGSGASSNYAELQLREDTTSIATVNNAVQYLYTVGARQHAAINFVRSPNTTSEVQYRLYNNEISGGATYQYYQQAWTLMEIKG